LIPRANITAWRSIAPWPSNEQVEQDLVISRALIALFSHRGVADRVVFRGGTALHKLFFDAGSRYSEDIDLVQWDVGPIGELSLGFPSFPAVNHGLHLYRRNHAAIMMMLHFS